MSNALEDVTVSQLAAAIQSACEDVSWLPGFTASLDDYYRQVALRTQGHLRRSGIIGRADQPTRERVLAALSRVKVHNPCADQAT